jgi:hypothetical protein
MKRFAVVVATMLVALTATGVFAQGDDARPRRQMKNVFVFIGTIKEISGNKLTIDIDKVMQPGKGEVEFSQDQWTFKFDKGAKIFRNDSPAELGDFGTGDRVVVEARKRSERNYEPIRMSDEDTARRAMDRMRERQGGGPNGQRGPQTGPGEMGGPGIWPDMGPGMGQGMNNRPGMQFIQKFGIPVHGKILEINKRERVLIIKPQIPEAMMNRIRQRRQGRRGGDRMGPPPQDDQNGPPPGGQEFAPPPQGAPGPNGRPMMRRMPEKIAVKITDDTKIYVGGKPGRLTSFKRGQEVVVMLEPPPRPMPMGGPGIDRGMMPDLSHPIPAKYLLDMKSAKAFREKMMKEWRNRRNQGGGGPDNGWGPPPDDGNGPPPQPPQQDGHGRF